MGKTTDISGISHNIILADSMGETWDTFDELSLATSFEKHRILVNCDSFRNVQMTKHAKPETMYFADQFDFRLVSSSPAVDAGCQLPNINDGYSGSAPDLGALKMGGDDVVCRPRIQ